MPFITVGKKKKKKERKKERKQDKLTHNNGVYLALNLHCHICTFVNIDSLLHDALNDKVTPVFLIFLKSLTIGQNALRQPVSAMHSNAQRRTHHSFHMFSFVNAVLLLRRETSMYFNTGAVPSWILHDIKLSKLKKPC